MTIFVTGATGFIGFPVAATLARAGHDVYGLTRSEEKAARLSTAEIAPVIGDMATPDTWIAAARRAEVVIHCAAEYSTRYMELDRQTADYLIGLRAPLFLYTSGCWLYGATGDTPVDETAPIHPPAAVTPRVETERVILAANAPAARTLIIRPGCVYGGEGSLTAAWFASAKNEGATRIVGDGNFRWAMVHNADLADLYRLAVESNLAGELLNAVDGGSHTVLECARAVARTVTGNEKVVVTPLMDAAKQMGGMAECLIMNQRLTSAKAHRLLGWQPRHTNFVDGVARYYRSWQAPL
ncbi:MAG: NAD-dependent epimerase/dehydratase family protein [Bryobacteraceae bacterium]